MNTKRTNPSCRPGTTEAMERLAAENEALRVERDEALARVIVLEATIASIYSKADDTPAKALASMKAQGAREALQRAMEEKGFSKAYVSVNTLQAVIEKMEKDNG